MDAITGAGPAGAVSANDTGLSGDYRAFLEAKIPTAQRVGFTCSLDDVPTHLADGRPIRDHQRACIRWAVEGGRRALFEAFGLGKSIQQLLICDIILDKIEASLAPEAKGETPNIGLIVAPLGVRREFMKDAGLLGLKLHFVKSDAEIDATGDLAGLFLTNYESVRDGKIDVSRFNVVSLDEASVLRSFGSKTYQTFLPLFDAVPYRFVATATPSPNRYKELIHYAGFLGVMDTGQALTRFFQRNSEKAGDLTLYPHKTDEFFLWLNTWAVFIQRPSDLCRCSCHDVQTSSASALGGSSSSSGMPGQSGTGHGSATAIAEAPTPQPQAISPVDGSSVAAACDRGMAASGPAHTVSGRPCCSDVETQTTRTGPIMEGEGSRSTIDGTSLGSSSKTWDNPVGARPSSASITTEDTNPATADGPPGEIKHETLGDQSCCGIVGASNPLPHGPKRSGAAIGNCTAATSSAGQQSGYSPTSCRECRCNDGYDLPPLTVRWHPVQTDLADAGADKRGQGRLIREAAMGITEAAREKRATLSDRVAAAAVIVESAPADHFILWHDLEDERRSIEAALPGIDSVYGAQDLDRREGVIERFAEGLSRLLAAKPVMLGSGTNLQRHCHRAIFVGVGFKFNDFIQSIHRLQRFQQPHPVEIDIIHAETEQEVVRDLQAKWARHEELAERMSEIIRKYGLQHDIALEGLKRTIGVERREASGERWALANNDCVDEAARLEPGSIDLIVTSIPFSNHYEYTPSYNDFGHTDDDAHFFAQMDHLTPKLFAALAPGRLACIHVKDRILFGSVTGEGVPTVNPFHAKTIFHYLAHGFQFMGMIHVNTDVVRENNQTYRLSYSEMLKDGTKMGVGSPEYVLLMRKPQTDRSRGYADQPVGKTSDDYSLARWQIDAHAFWRSSGDRPLTPDELADNLDRFASMPVGPLVKRFMTETRELIYDHEAHVAIGEKIEARDGNDERGHLPRTFMSIAPGAHDPNTWDDVVRMRTLNAEQVRKGAEKHVCPLQFDIVDRLIDRFSMAGEMVFDPFAGLGTVPMRAIAKGRRGSGSELNASYFDFACQYLAEAEREAATPSLFDLLGMDRAA